MATIHNRSKNVHTFIKNVDYKDNDPHSTSSILVRPFSKFMLKIDLDKTGTPTRIRIDVEFSHDNTNWFKYQNGPFGLLQYEDTMCPVKDAQSGDCIDYYMRLTVTGTGCDNANYFTINEATVIVMA